MSKKNNNSVRVEVTNDKDLILTFNFDKKVIEIESSQWTVQQSKRQIEKDNKKIEEIKPNWSITFDKKDEIKPNKKVRASKQESQFEKFIQLFTLLDDMDTFQEGVSFRQIKQALTNKGIASDINEINNLVNEALSKDLIIGAEKYGYYRRK